MDRDQKLFIAHCREFLSNYPAHREAALSAYRKAHDAETVEHKKDNAGTRAGNLYMLERLKMVGAENWRPEKGKPKGLARPVNASKPINTDLSSVAYKPKTDMPSEYNGKILMDAGL